MHIIKALVLRSHSFPALTASARTLCCDYDALSRLFFCVKTTSKENKTIIEFFEYLHKSRTKQKMAGIQKLVVFNLAIILPIFVLAATRDESSPDLDPDLGRAADISIFTDNEEIETPIQVDDEGPNAGGVSLKI